MEHGFQGVVSHEKSSAHRSTDADGQLQPVSDRHSNCAGDDRRSTAGICGGVSTLRAAGFDPLRDWFTALYQVLLGADKGPRFGSFVALYGVAETRLLIADALAGKLLKAAA